MHTALCAFDDRARAEQAREGLLRTGFAPQDVHIEHRHAPDEARDAGDRWEPEEGEAVADRGMLSSFGHFFASLLGGDNPSGHVDTYGQHVERGAYVVVVDAVDEAQARRAQGILDGLQGGDVNVVHRQDQPALRDVVSRRGDPELERAPGLRYADQD